MSSYDAIVIGGGHNGLVAAATLARAGKRVLVLEGRAHLGGAAATEEIFPGYQVNTGSSGAGLLLPEIVAELGLEAHGLDLYEPPAQAHAFGPGGVNLTLWRDPERTAEEIGRFSTADAKAYPKFTKKMAGISGVLRSMMLRTPPVLPEYQLGELLAWAGVALQARRLGDRDMMELLRVLAMPVATLLDEHFESPLLKAALAVPALRGSMQGPLAGGTALMLAYQATGASPGSVLSCRFVRGGTGMFSRALAAAAVEAGADIRTGCRVAGIRLQDGRAGGVRLDNGQAIDSGLVLSSADPGTTFLTLVGPQHLDPEFVRAIRNIKYQGSTARVILALKGLPDFAGQDDPGQLTGRSVTAADMLAIERAFDDAKYGRISDPPVLEFTIPTLSDPDLAPAGRHLMLVDVRYAPYKLKGMDWDQGRQVLLQRVLQTLAAIAPDLADRIEHQAVLTPLDFEAGYGLPQGSIYHGQMGLDQLLMMRPVGGYGRYATPVEGLFLCGAGTHPGGGVTGAPGRNAARQALKEVPSG